MHYIYSVVMDPTISNNILLFALLYPSWMFSFTFFLIIIFRLFTVFLRHLNQFLHISGYKFSNIPIVEQI